jgi:hypothetical protein
MAQLPERNMHTDMCGRLGLHVTDEQRRSAVPSTSGRGRSGVPNSAACGTARRPVRVLLASPPIDWHLTDAYLVVARFRYVLFGISVFAVFGVYFWLPKIAGSTGYPASAPNDPPSTSTTPNTPPATHRKTHPKARPHNRCARG